MANFIVSIAADDTDGNTSAGNLSLREAVALSNVNAGADTISFAAALAGQTLVLTQGELALVQDVTIGGDTNGDGKADIEISGNDASRIFHVTGATTDAAIRSLTLRNGNAVSAGPGGPDGGAILAAGAASLDIQNTTIRDCTAASRGGGLSLIQMPSVTITNSLITGNFSQVNTGGLIASEGFVTLTNTTVDGNRTGGYIGGVTATEGAVLNLQNCTVTGNQGNLAGGLGVFAGAIVNVLNSAVAGDFGAVSGYIATAVRSVFGSNVSIGVNSGSLENVADLGLGALLDNGGAVLTRSPLDGSVLIGFGLNAAIPADIHDIDGDGNSAEPLPRDGRDGVRLVGGAVDAGAVEQVLDETINGTTGNDVIIGGLGDDTLLGRGGNDSLAGGQGDNTINGDSGNDTILSNGGVDMIDGGADSDTLIFDRRSTSVALIMNMVALGTVVTVAGDGSTVVNVETVFYDGGSGVDTVTTLGGNDRLRGYAGNDVLNGGAGADNIDGGTGGDTLNGGLGADSMTGGIGNDVYVIDNAGDATSEFAGGGDDLVQSSITHVLSGNVERLTLTGSANINGTGNALMNTINGNGGGNVLNGLKGDDVMRGGDGNDTYHVDAAGDVVDEAGSGVDTVHSALNYTLGSNVEKLFLLAGAVNGTGNGQSNHIYGNAGDNFIDGMAGADRLRGNGGNDTYFVDSSGDRVFETISGAAGGADRVFSSVNFTLSANVERLSLTGVANINGTGNSDANSLAGNSGNNFIDGRLGADALAGGLGLDNFVFTTALGGGNVDYIFDFTAADDTIRLDNAVFAGLANSYLAVAAFHTGSAALDASDRIVYDSTTGALYFNADGAGGVVQVQFAALVAGLALTNADVYVF